MKLPFRDTHLDAFSHDGALTDIHVEEMAQACWAALKDPECEGLEVPVLVAMIRHAIHQHRQLERSTGMATSRPALKPEPARTGSLPELSYG